MNDIQSRLSWNCFYATCYFLCCVVVLLVTGMNSWATTPKPKKRHSSAGRTFSLLFLTSQEKKAIASLQQKSQLYQFLKKKVGSTTSYRLQLLWAELLYEKAQLSWGKSNAAKGPVRIWLRLAATQYEKVAKHPNKKYRKNALFGAVLCYESLLKGRGKAHLPLRTVSKRGGVSHSGTLRMLGKSWSLTWPRLSIQPNSLNQKLLRAYKNYLSVLNARSDIEAITQTRFKEGTLYYERKHYLKSIAIFTRLVKLYPNHKLSRRAVFMILYSLEDLQLWGVIAMASRFYLKNAILTKPKVFRRELYQMLIRSSYIYVLRGQLKERLSTLAKAKKMEAYEKSFGPYGSWVKKGFAPSPKTYDSLALAGIFYVQSKRLLDAIRVRKRFLRLYPTSGFSKAMCYELANSYEQIASYKQAAFWYERYVFGLRNSGRWLKAFEPQPKEPTPKVRRKRRKRYRRRSRRKRRRVVNSRARARKIARRTHDALYKAATYRRALGQHSRAIVLYRHYCHRYMGKSRDIPHIYLAIAELYKAQKHWEKALGTYHEYLNQFQSVKIEKYLKRSLKLQRRYFDRVGLLTWHIPLSKLDMLDENTLSSDTSMTTKFLIPNMFFQKSRKESRRRLRLRRKLGTLPKRIFREFPALWVHSQIASLMQKMGKLNSMEERYMMVDALGFQLFHQPSYNSRPYRRDRVLYAQAKFHLLERRFRALSLMKFSRSSRKNRTVLRRMKLRMYELHRDYFEVMELKSPTWSLASGYKIGLMYQQFAEKLKRAVRWDKRLLLQLYPKLVLKARKRSRKGNVVLLKPNRNLVDVYVGKAMMYYTQVIQQASLLGLFDKWARRALKARNSMRSRQKVYPYTIIKPTLRK